MARKLSLKESERSRHIRAHFIAKNLEHKATTSFQDVHTGEGSNLYNYIDGDSTKINRAMWAKHAKKIPKDDKNFFKRKSLADAKSKGRELANTLAKHAPETSEDIHVFHGWKPNTPPTPGVHKVKGFLSTSVDPTVTRTFANTFKELKHDETGKPKIVGTRHVLRIKVAKGTKHGAYVSHFHPDYDLEKEFLIRPGRKLHIKGKPKVLKLKHNKNHWDDPDELHYHVWPAELKESLKSYIDINQKVAFHGPRQTKSDIVKSAIKSKLADNYDTIARHRRSIKVQKVDKELRQHTKFGLNDVSPIRQYTMGSADLNHSLWDQYPRVKENTRKYGKNDYTVKQARPIVARAKWQERTLTKTLDRSAPLPKDVVVYHGWKGDKPPSHMSSMKTKGFLSTSIDPNTAGSFAKYQDDGKGKHLLRIKLPKGSKHGAYVDHVSEFESEREFILKPKRKLTFKKAGTINHKYKGKIHVWHTEIKEAITPAKTNWSRYFSKLDKKEEPLKTSIPWETSQRIKNYTLASTEVNDSLWNRMSKYSGIKRDLERKGSKGRQQVAKNKIVARKLIHGINKLDGPAKDTVVYHGWGGKDHPTPGMEFKAKGFLSTSLSPKVAARFGRNIPTEGSWTHSHILRIRVPAGSKHGVYVADHSHHKHEREFLMKPGRKLVIKNHRPIVRVNKETRDKEHYWHAELKESIRDHIKYLKQFYPEHEAIQKAKKYALGDNWHEARDRRSSKANKIGRDLELTHFTKGTESIQDYTAAGSRRINPVLWGEKDHHRTKDDPHGRTMIARNLIASRKLTRELDKTDSSLVDKKEFVVYHGWKGQQAPKEMSSIKTKGFLSTSLDPDVAHGFAKKENDYENGASVAHLLRMKIKPGTKHGAYVDHVSNARGEQEFILKPKRKLTFKKFKTIENKYGGGKLHVWDVDIKESWETRQNRISDIHNKLTKHTKSDYKGQWGARWNFNKYIHGMSHDLNKTMWNKPPKDQPGVRRQAVKKFQFGRQLTKSMNKSKGMRDDTVIYHGYKGNNDLHVGKELKTKGFLSTSLSIDTAKRFATMHIPTGENVFQPDNKTINPNNVHHVLRIKLPKGSKHGVYVTPFSSSKGYASEKEVLLRPKRKLVITKGPHKHTDEKGDNYHFWHAELKESQTKNV